MHILSSKRYLLKNGAATFVKQSIASYEADPDATALAAFELANTDDWTTANLVILQLGDNINTAQKISDFTTTFPLLVEAIRTEVSAARIMCVGRWWADESVEAIITNACDRYGAVYVSISGYHTDENEGVIGATVTYIDATTGTILEAWATHPGNTGMTAIATAMIAMLDM